MNIALLIPVHNVAPYLGECLQSALAAGAELARALPGSALRLFCRDDGSTDESPAILSQYAAAHPGRITIATQANTGVAVARNRLMEGLPGDVEAFAFLDADDTVAPGIYAALAEAMMRTGADVAETEWDGEECVLDDMTPFVLRGTAPGKWITVWNKLYRREAIGEVRFRAGLCFEEDFLFNYDLHRHLRRKVLVSGRFYNYRTNPQSATHVLNQARYFDSSSRRIRIFAEEYLAAGKIPETLRAAFRAELVKDCYRMCVRKNLKKNRDSAMRRDLFMNAGELLRELAREHGLVAEGLNPIQRLVCAACRAGHYRTARALTYLT